MSQTTIFNTPLPFDALAEAVSRRRSTYGHLSGLQLDRAAPAGWLSLQRAA